MSSLNYTTFVTQLANLMVETSTDSNFQTFLPGCIDYAEQRIYRDLDLLYTRQSDMSGAFVANARVFTLPIPSAGSFIVVEEMNAITPAGAASSGTRVPLQFVSKQYIDTVYPSAYTGTGVPRYAAMLTNTDILVGPAPDNSYSVEVVGTYRPVSLSITNSSTILTQYIPDLFMAAAMVYGAAYMRDFGSQSDNPQVAQSWENQYMTLSKTANVEQFRAKYQSQGWTPEIPNPIATPQRV